MFAHVAAYIGPCAATQRRVSVSIADVAGCSKAPNAPIHHVAGALNGRAALQRGLAAPLRHVAVTLCRFAALQ